MTALLRPLRLVSVAAILLACGNAPIDTESLGEAQQALNACNETVPVMRAVDGFPAYAQCAGIQDGAIWSNNGVDTASSSQGAGWVRTQFSGGYQCTELARRYNLFRWGIDYQHGNAGEWCDGTLPSTLAIATSPVHGDLIVFAPGSCGADSTTGHIAVVDIVDKAAGKVTIVEQNQAGRRSTQQSCAKCFLHAVENDGSVGGTASGGAASGGSPAGGAPAGGTSSGGTSGGASSAGAVSGGSPSAAGASSSAGTSSGGAPAGGSPSAGSSASGVAGAPGSSGASVGGSTVGVSGAPANPAGFAGASAGSEPADDAGCSVARVGSRGRGAPPSAAFLLAAFALLWRLRRRPLGLERYPA